MTLGEYLNDNADIEDFCILILTEDDSVMSIECNNVEDVYEELLESEFMEANEDDGVLGIWVR